MNQSPGVGERARWEVIYVRDRRLHRISTGADFHEALRLYTLAVQSPDRANVTLRSKNVAFPPPEKFMPRTVVFEKPRRTRDGQIVTQVHVVPMDKLNREGVWWCPFCIKLRRFKYEKGWWTQEEVWVAEPQMVCPVCRVTHNSFDVRKWNPLATQLFYSQDVRNPNARPRRLRARRPRKKEED